MVDIKQDIKETVGKAISISRVLAFIFVLFLSLFCIIYVLSKTSLFQNWAKDRIVNLINKESDFKIKIQDIHVDIVNGISLKHALLNDHHQDTLFYGGNLTIGLRQSLISLFSNSLYIKDVEIDSSVFKIISYHSEERNSLNHFLYQIKPKSKSSKSVPFLFFLETISAKSFRYQRVYEESSRYEDYYVGSLGATIEELNTNAGFLRFGKVVLSEPNISVVKKIALRDSVHRNIAIIDTIPSEVVDPDIKCSLPFVVQIKSALIKNGSFAYRNENNAFEHFDTTKLPSMDFNDFQVVDINSSLTGFIYNDLDFFGSMNFFNAKSSSGLTIKNIKINNGAVTSKYVNLQNFIIETDKSILKDTLELKYSKYESYLNFVDAIFINFKSKNSKVAVEDIAQFFSKIADDAFFIKNKDQTFKLSGTVFGKVNSLKIPKLDFEFGDKIKFTGNFASRNLAKFGEEILNIKADKFQSSIKNLQDIFPGFKVPTNLVNIGNFTFRGNFDGYIGDFVSYGKFTTDLGIANTDINLNFRNGNTKATYSGALELVDFELGTIIGIPDLKQVNLKTVLRNGVGLTWESLNADLTANLESAVFKNNVYRNLNFNGNFNNSLLDGKLKMDDEFIKFSFEGKISEIRNSPFFQFNANVAHLDLQKLNLTKEPFIAKASIDINMKGKSIDEAIGKLKLKDIVLRDQNKDQALLIENLDVQVEQVGIDKKLIVDSEFGKIAAEGKFVLSDLLKDIKGILKSNIPSLPFGENQNLNHIDLSYTIRFVNSRKLLTYLNIPVKSDLAIFEGKLNSDQKLLTVNSNVTDFEYQGIKIKNFKLLSEWNNTAISSKLYADKVNFFDRLTVPNVNLLQNGNSTQSMVSLYSLDSDQVSKKYEMIGLVKHNSKFISLEIPSNQFLFDDVFWYISSKHSLAYSNGNLFFKNFSFTDSTRYISVANYDQKGLKLNVDGFDIAVVNQFINAKGLALSGLFNFELTLENYFKLVNIRATANVFQFHVNKSNYGPLQLSLFLPNENSQLNVEFLNQFRDYKISGMGTVNVPIAKNYKYPKYDAEILLELLNTPAKYLEDYIPGISKTKGSLDGHVFLNLINKRLLLTGELEAKKLSTKINYLGAVVNCNQGKIALNRDLIQFNNIKLADELNNPMLLNGYLKHKNLSSFTVDCNVSSDKALILNTTKDDNPNYYGYGLCKFDASFLGDLSKVNINISAISLKGSKLVIPVNYDQSADSKDFVSFVKNEQIDSVKIVKPLDVRGMNLKMNISVFEDSEVQIVFDEDAGDVMKSFGRGNLQINSLRDNTFSMTGDYIVERGQYLFTLLNVVNKPFQILRGGTIKWTGDPLNANINLIAKYEGLYSTVYSFIEEYLFDQADVYDEAKSRTQIDLSMNLNGSLLKPDISFKLAFPTLTGDLKNYTDIKLKEMDANPDLLNQQVFGLLVFGTFLNTANPFQTSLIQNTGINTLSEMLSSQFSLFVTNLLSEAFNNVDFISGVDFNVAYDVVEDPIVSQNRIDQGEFVFTYRQRLWNDQWAVTLGGNYKTTPSIYGNTNFTPESVIEWNTPINGLKLRIYYKSDDSFLGIKHKVGSGVTYRREFDSFSDFKNALKERFRKKDGT